MEDILSLDDDVLNSVFEYHLPPIRRLPSILWSRIRADIEGYITNREADGATVMAWHHRHFTEVAKKYFTRYRGWARVSADHNHPEVGEEDELLIANTLCEYFRGRWSGGVSKPFKYTDKLVKKYTLTSEDGSEDR